MLGPLAGAPRMERLVRIPFDFFVLFVRVCMETRLQSGVFGDMTRPCVKSELRADERLGMCDKEKNGAVAE